MTQALPRSSRGRSCRRRHCGRSGVTAEIFLLRHGETEWNAAGRFQGQWDSTLTARGHEQAAQLGRILVRALAGRLSVPLHVSPLGRTRDTAAIVRRSVPGLAPDIIEPRLQEVSTGAWDGLTRADPGGDRGGLARVACERRRVLRPHEAWRLHVPVGSAAGGLPSVRRSRPRSAQATGRSKNCAQVGCQEQAILQTKGVPGSLGQAPIAWASWSQPPPCPA